MRKVRTTVRQRGRVKQSGPRAHDGVQWLSNRNLRIGVSVLAREDDLDRLGGRLDAAYVGDVALGVGTTSSFVHGIWVTGRR
jgi:hypothetical protein